MKQVNLVGVIVTVGRRGRRKRKRKSGVVNKEGQYVADWRKMERANGDEGNRSNVRFQFR